MRRISPCQHGRFEATRRIFSPSAGGAFIGYTAQQSPDQVTSSKQSVSEAGAPHVSIVLFSDTHELHRNVDVPKGDVLICCGDFTMSSKSLSAIEDFDEWLGEQPHKLKLCVPGNHEFFLEADHSRRSLLPSADVLINEALTSDGLTFYGSPTTCLLGGAFGISSPAVRRAHWAKIPVHTNVLITHSPPHGILDRSPGQQEHAGDPELLTRISELKSLRLHCFGHIHGAYGAVERNGVTFCNVALPGADGHIANEPMLINMSTAVIRDGTDSSSRKSG